MGMQSGLVVSVLYPNDPYWNFGKVHNYCYEHEFTIVTKNVPSGVLVADVPPVVKKYFSIDTE